jgi:serine/threonine-protein kinase
MEPPIASGTTLQNRYHVMRVLGQGGFGRTYLAEDRGRFSELCALKELIPSQTEDYALDKSRELFQREATTLYQIKHPQVPEFRATFEEDGRLFLVQDYVEGKTYRELLEERKEQQFGGEGQARDRNVKGTGASRGGIFSETEIRQLLQQMLPVLDHIHRRGIIHRDITPDNIILRNSDNMPILIDFGVVKELATRIQSPGMSTPATTVGKIGYAPSEQIQTGRAYPSSDLYSLAVSAIVLLTGKEPQELMEQTQLRWNWRQEVSISEHLAAVLDRMLSYRPGDRYQSSVEVMQALRTFSSPPTRQQQPEPTNLTQAATVAVGRPPAPAQQQSTPSAPQGPQRPDASIPEPSRGSSLWDNPWAVVGIGAVLAILAGLGSWAIVGALTRREPQVSPTPTETLAESPSPTPTETTSPTPTEFSRQLELEPGQTITESDNLQANSTVNYTFQAEQGQRLSASMLGEGVLMTVLGPNQNPVGDRARRVLQWEGTLPFTGEYTIQLSPVQGLQESDYSLQLSLASPPAPSPSPTATASPSPSPTTPTTPSSPTTVYETEQVNLPGGTGNLELVGQTSPQQIRRYVVPVQVGQQLTVDAVQGDVAMDIRYPNGQPVEDASGVRFWQAQLPRGGNYRIDVRAQEPTNFTIDLSVENLEQ